MSSGQTIKFRAFGLLLVVGLLAAACGDDGDGPSEVAATIYDGDCAESTGTEVVVYSGRSENLMEPIFEAFECETGVSVAEKWGDSADLALLIEADGERSEADVYLSRSPGPVGFLEARGLLDTVDPDVLDLVSEENRGGESTWVGFSGRQRVMVYNTDAIATEDLPASVFDLTGEEWRGRVAIPASNGSFIDWFTVFRSVHGDDVATQWLNDMVANDAELYANNRAIVEAAGRGEIDAGLVNHYYNHQELAAAGDAHHARNHGFADDDIGGTLIITAGSVLAGSDAPEEANQLLGYLLGEPVQRYFADETFEYPLAAGVEPNEVLPPLSSLEVGSVDFDALGGGFATTTDIIEASGILS